MNLIETFPAALANTAINYLGCSEKKDNQDNYLCYTEIIQYYAENSNLNEQWCMKFVWSMVDKTCFKFGKKNPILHTASTLAFKAAAEKSNIPVDRIASPGAIRFNYREGGGHVGIVLEVDGNHMKTIEGNSQDKVRFVEYKDYTKNNLYFIHIEKLFENDFLIAGVGQNYFYAGGALVIAGLITRKLIKK